MKKIIQALLLCLLISTAGMAQTSNAQITELNSSLFKQKVWNFSTNKTFKKIGKTPVILDFYATWCRPCKMLAPHLETIQNKYKGKLIVYRIDVDQQPELAKLFNITAMPTIVFINSKTSYQTEVGYRNYDEFESLVKKYFSLN